MEKEYLLYGLRHGETERYTEELLATGKTKAAVEAVIPRAMGDGWHSFRVATFDGSPPDFTKSVNA
jgi:hypothetical protein